MATRLYFPVTTAAPINPGFGAWGYVTEALRRYLAKTKGSSTITLGSQIGPWTATAGFTALDRQYVSDQIAAQTISGTVAMQLMVREYSTNDNVDRLLLLIKVVDNTGALRGTLLALGNYGPTLEFISNATHRNKTGATAQALSSVNALDGDRIVVEIGYTCSGSCATPEGSAKWGENAADLPVNETQTTDGAGWIEFSANITWATVMKYLQGVSDGVATAIGMVSIVRRLLGASGGVSTATAVPTRKRPVVGASAGIAMTVGALLRRRPLAGASDGLATAIGVLSSFRTVYLAGISDGLASTVGTVQARRGLVGQGAGVASATGILTMLRGLAGASDGLASTIGVLIRRRPFAGVSAGLASTQGVLGKGAALVGISDGYAGAVGALSRLRLLVGASSGVSGTSGVLQAVRGLFGSSAGQATATGILRFVEEAKIFLYGLSQGLSSAVGTLQRVRGMMGLSEGKSSAFGVLSVEGLLRWMYDWEDQK